MGKQFRELSEVINDPTGVAGRKISPLIRIGKNQVWPDPQWQREIADNEFWSLKGLEGRAKTLAKDVTPYSITQQQRVGEFSPVSFAMPISRGMTPYNAKKYFKKAIANKDKKLLARTYKASIDNGIDADSMLKMAASGIKSEERFESRMDAQKYILKYRKLGPVQGEIYLKKLRQDGKITPLVLEEINKLLKKKGKAKARKKAFDRITEGN